MKPKLPKEDPRLKAQRERADQIAEQEVVSETQRRLEDQTALFSSRFGARAAVGGLKSFGTRKPFQTSGGFGGFGGVRF